MKVDSKRLVSVSLAAGLLIVAAGCVAPQPAPAPRTVYVDRPVQPPAPPPPPNAPTATANVRDISRVTHDPAPEYWPRSSPDGSRLLFHVFDTTKSDASGFSIVLIELGKAGRKLIAGPYAQMPAWYPDGSQFVYQYLKSAKPIFVRTPIGGVGMTFISPSALGDADVQPHVSPDGKRIAFHTKMGGGYSICAVDSDGGNFTVYTEGFSPRWHPDGTKLSFDKAVGNHSQCFVLDLVSGQVTQLTMGDVHNAFPVWSPDGNWVVFVSDRDGKKHLYCMRPDGSQVTQLTRGESQESFPEWSADGFIYFVSDAGSPTAMPAEAFRWTYCDIWRLRPILPEKK